MYYDIKKYQKELKNIKLQNNIECELYSIVASIIRESDENICLRDVTMRRRTKTGEESRYYGESGFPDFVVVSCEERGTPEILGAVEVKYLGKTCRNEKDKKQLEGHICTFNKVLYTNGLIWEFHSVKGIEKVIEIPMNDIEEDASRNFKKLIKELSVFWNKE